MKSQRAQEDSQVSLRFYHLTQVTLGHPKTKRISLHLELRQPL